MDVKDIKRTPEEIAAKMWAIQDISMDERGYDGYKWLKWLRGEDDDSTM